MIGGGGGGAVAAGAPAAGGGGGGIPMTEVAKHNSKTDCWVVVDGQVLDVTSFLGEHPGGELAILTFAGKDATEEFNMKLGNIKDKEGESKDRFDGLVRDHRSAKVPTCIQYMRIQQLLYCQVM